MADNRKACQQPIELELAESKHLFFLLRGPLELGFFQAFIPEREARFIPIEYFHFILLLIGKQEQRTRVQGQIRFRLNQCRQSVDGFSKVNELTVQVDSWRVGELVNPFMMTALG